MLTLAIHGSLLLVSVPAFGAALPPAPAAESNSLIAFATLVIVLVVLVGLATACFVSIPRRHRTGGFKPKRFSSDGAPPSRADSIDPWSEAGRRVSAEPSEDD